MSLRLPLCNDAKESDSVSLNNDTIVLQYSPQKLYLCLESRKPVNRPRRPTKNRITAAAILRTIILLFTFCNDSLQLFSWMQHTYSCKQYGLECTTAAFGGPCQDSNCGNMSNAQVVDENKDWLLGLTAQSSDYFASRWALTYLLMSLCPPRWDIWPQDLSSTYSCPLLLAEPHSFHVRYNTFSTTCHRPPPDCCLMSTVPPSLGIPM